MEWCIREIWCTSIKFIYATCVTHDPYTDIYPVINIHIYTLQACTESQIKLLKMFESADQDGDGDLSLTEFMLAESWWLRCTLNPTNAHLF